MGASYDAINDRAVLAGDGLGYARVKKALPAAPAGADQVIYIMRYWTSGATSAYDAGLTTEPAFHYGFNFGSAHPQKATTFSEASHLAAYADFFGMGQFPWALTADVNKAGYSQSSNLSHSVLYRSGGSGNYGVLSDGNGGSGAKIGYTVTAPTSVGALYNHCHMSNGAANAAYMTAYTYIWRVRRLSAVTEEIRAECWMSSNSMDLSTFDLSTDIDPEDPTQAFPPYSGVAGAPPDRISVINGLAEVGTNWMPVSNTMAFPTYFMAAYPNTSQAVTIDYVGVRYDSLF